MVFLGLLRRCRARGHGSGQSLVELALVLPVLLLVVLVALDFGRVFYGYVTLTNATRIGANYAAAHPTAWGTPGDAAERAEYQQLVLRDTNNANCSLVPGAEPVPTPSFRDGPDTDPPDTSTDVGDWAEVGLSCTFNPITPIIGAIVGNSLVMSANAEFSIRAGKILGVPVAPPPTPGPTPAPTPTPDPGATPTPTPTPAPTPTPTPSGLCNVPNFVANGTKKNSVAGLWTGAGFTGAVTYNPDPNGNWTVQTQSLPAGPAPCTSAITVGG